MKNNFLTQKKRKYMLLLVLCLSGIFVLSGCGNIHKWLDKWTHGDMAGVTTNCNVFSVDGTLGAYNYVCQNSSHTYIYHNNAICDYDTMEPIIEVDNLEYMACNDDVLYYSVNTHGGELFCYDFSEANNTLVTDEYRVTGMKANGDDVFVSQRMKISKSGGPENYTYELVYYHKKEDGINVSKWVSENTEKSIVDEYKIYEFEGYNIVEDISLNEDEPQLVYIENAEGFQYSCYGYHTYAQIGENYLRLSNDVSSRYSGKEETISTIVEAEDAYAGLSASQIGFDENQVYMIEQYGRGTPKYQENPSRDFKVSDAFFKFIPETGDCEMLYQAEKGEQIAGFSLKKNALYLLRNDGVYQYDLENEKETCLLENEQYECLAFEYVDDKLFIFSNPYSADSQVELLFVVE